jgi:thiol-disulfide isomerase/thioredoxin
MRKLFIAFAIIVNILITFAAIASAQSDLSILYFFSTTCGHCKSVEPVVKELSKTYHLEGLVYGKGAPVPMPFAVRKGDKETSSTYGISGVPVLVVLKGGMVKQIIRGENDIRTCPRILIALSKGALSVSEMIAKGPKDTYNVTGWVESKGDYFKGVKFYLTDRQKRVEIKPWLPLEAVKSPFNSARPRLMSDIIDKPVSLKGMLVQIDNNLQFTVEKELTLE